MKVEHLAVFGIPEIIVESWRDKLGEKLLPIQERAITEGDILNGQSLLITSPTCSGKTFCGELAAAAVIFKRKKALFVVPLKSIAEEKYADFQAKYRPLGIKVVISTRDHVEFDRDLETGRFDLAILIYEKLNQLLVRNVDLLNSVDLVVIDEVQMLGDPERGATLELALIKLKSVDQPPQLVALSAVLKNPVQLAQWLGCQLLEDDYRPVELRQGVLAEGLFRYRNFNSGIEGEEILSEAQSDQPEELLVANVEHLVGQGEQVLIFLKGKRDCEQMATAIAERNFWSRADQTIAELADEIDSTLSKKLAQTLECGVAFHHADLSYRQRQILEEGFRRGEIKVLVSTTTLAMGVNLPAQTVFIDCWKYQLGAHSGKPMVVPLCWCDYEGMSGRAGRLNGQKTDYGRSILVAATPIEAETMWNAYVCGQPEELQSELFSHSLPDIVLDLLASRSACDYAELTRLLRQSLHAFRGGIIDESELAAVITALEQVKLVFRNGAFIETSPVGTLLSLKGISVASGGMMTSFVQRYTGSDWLSWLYLALSLPDAKLHLLYADKNEEERIYLRRRLREYLSGTGETAPELGKLLSDNYLLSESQRIRLKTALLLADWVSDLPTVDLETRYRVHIGSILQTAEAVAWLLDGFSAVASLLNQSAGLVAEIRRLGKAVSKGYDLPGSFIDKLGLKAEQRDLAWALHKSGIAASDRPLSPDRAELTKMVGEPMAERLMALCNSALEGEKNKPQEYKSMSNLTLRGNEVGERVLLQFAGTDIDLTHKSFNYLFKLTAARLLKNEGWLDKEELEPGLNQAKNIYRVKQELRKFGTKLENFIENRAGFYRLNLLPEQIRIDFQSMKCFSDMELVELTKRLEAPVAHVS